MNIISYKYSFILPIYNPGKSLITALKCYENLFYKNFEIILVDDSSENTFDKMHLEILKIESLRYFHRKKKEGLDAAFNFGIKKSTGDIIVMATDDNLPKNNFLNDLNKIYNEGFDFVIGRSKVLNSDNIFALYQSCYENHNYNKKYFKPHWSEGFSVKKKCIESVGLYEDIGIDGGNDNMLSEKLERKYKVKRDFNLIMHHRAPDNFRELFDQQIQRGSAGPQFDNLFFKKSKVFIFSKYLTKFSINLFNFLTQLYFIYLSFLFLKSANKRNFFNFFKILFSINMKYLLHNIGELKALKEIA